ncbi:MAG: heavy-metal-associated domain-containing protein [Bacteroidales bacterium]|jgi:copper chaperone CopZ|nr:heavy-metal-associated domain-containing protein [Bacteroidales bacterium]
MKKFFALMLLAAIFTACNSTVTDKASQASNKEVNAAAVKTVKLHVTGMTCEGCENTVKEAVTGVEGVTGAEASHVAELTTITYDTTLTNVEKLTTVINDLGYKVEGLADNSMPAE